VAADPNVPKGEAPMVEHAPAPLLVLGTVIVPVMPLGTGLTVGAIGEAPVPTGALGTIPSEDVAPSEGVSVPTWANAGLQHSNGNAVATMNNGLMEDSPIKA
jgi:hypothetical protein